MGHKRKRVKNITKPTPMVKNSPIDLNDTIYIDLTKYPKWTDTVKIGNFTNNLKDVHEASRHFFFVVDQLIPDIESYGKDIFSGKAKHCHILSKEAKETAIKVIRKIHGDNILDDDASEKIWELAAKKEEIRLIGVMIREKINRFYPLFIDHHHLIYPNEKYNQADYKNYKFTKDKIKTTK